MISKHIKNLTQALDYKDSDLGKMLSDLKENITSTTPKFINKVFNTYTKYKGSYNVKDFDGLASNWWDPAGPMKPLHKINPLRALYLDTNVNLAGKKLLDVGCGGGIFAEAMAERGAKVTAVDPSQQLINLAQQHSKQRQLKIDYICCDTQELLRQTSLQQSFDIVSCLEVLEHVDSPSSLVQDCATLLSPGGWGYFSTINQTLRSFLLAIVGAEYLLGWLPRGTHSYAKFIQPAELAIWLEANQLTPTKLKGIVYNPTALNFELSQQVHTNYLLLAQKSSAPKT